MKEMGNLMDEVFIYDDLIPKDIQQNLAATVKKELWGYNWQTAPEDMYYVWGRSVTAPLRGKRNAEQSLLKDGHQIDSAAIWKLFTQSFLMGHSLMRAFVIGFHHGCEGYAHGDNTDPEDNGQMGGGLNLANYRSTIIFASDEWDSTWGGEMVIYNRDMTDIVCAVEPKPFRVLSFPGLLPHKPNGPTREMDKFLPLLSFRSKQILRLNSEQP
jgi:SM-20-related protein